MTTNGTVVLNRKVPYRWVPRDAENAKQLPPATPPVDAQAKWTAYEARRVTPYGFVREMLPGCEGWAVGSTVSIDLTKSFLYRFEIDRFGELPPGVDWLEVSPDDLSGCATIGALCEKLLELGKGKLAEKYGGIYDAFQQKDESTEPARRRLAKAIFDHWDNTNYRYAVITSGKFDWADFDKNPWTQPIEASAEAVTYRITKVPTRVPKRKVVPSATGTHVVVAPDAQMEALEGDMRRIRFETRRIRALLDQSRTYMQERVKLAHQVTMLRVLLEASSTGAGELAPRAMELAKSAQAIEQTALKAVREEPLTELLDPRALKSAPSASVQAVIRKELGYIDDLAAAFDAAGKSLAGMLFDDDTFAARVEKWATYVIEKKLHETPAFQILQLKISDTFVEAILALTETPLSDAHQAKIEAILGSLPSAGLSVANVRKAGNGAIDKFLALTGKAGVWIKDHEVLKRAAAVSQIASNIVGNLAGPPSITIALKQWWQWRIFQKKINTFGSNDTLISDMEKLVEDTVKFLDENGAEMQDATRKAFQKAMRERDAAQLNAIKRDLLDEYSGALQAGAKAKTGALLLQLIVFAWAYSDYAKKDKKDVTVADVLGFGSTTATTLVVTADWGVTAASAAAKLPSIGKISQLANLPKQLAVISGALQKTGMLFGAVGGLIGAYTAVQAAYEAEGKGDSTGMWLNLAGAGGSLMIAFACGAWLAGMPVPGLNIVGLFVVIGSGIALFVHDLNEGSKTALSRAGTQIVAQVELNAFSDKVGERNDFAAKLKEIKAACQEGHLPSARNHPAIIKALADVGFRQADIVFLVEKSTTPFFVANTPTPT